MPYFLHYFSTCLHAKHFVLKTENEKRAQLQLSSPKKPRTKTILEEQKQKIVETAARRM